PVHVRQVAGVRAEVEAGHDVLDQDGAGGGAVALPQLPPEPTATVGREEQRAVHVRPVGGGHVRAQDGGGGGAGALRRAGVGGEEQRAVHVRQVAGVRAGGAGVDGAGVDVLDQRGAGGGAIALPQLVAVRAVVSHEEQHPVDVREPSRRGAVGAGAEVLDQH